MTMKATVSPTAMRQGLMKSYLVPWKMRSIGPLDAQRLGAARAVEPQEEEPPHDEHRRAHGRDDTGDEREVGPLHGTAAILRQHTRREDRGDVGVDDRRAGEKEAVVDGGAHRL